MKTGLAILMRREQIGMTQEELAKAVGVSKASISRWESGDISNMRRDRIQKLAEALKVSPIALLDEETDGFTDIKTMVSEQLKKARERKGISMRQAAIDMGFPYTTYVNYEKGVSEPNSEALVKIAVYYGVSADYLLGVEIKNSPPPVEDEREAYRKMLSTLSDQELIELKQFTSYLVWKRTHQNPDASKK